MTTPAEQREQWLDGNQRHLTAALERVRQALRQHIARREKRAIIPTASATGSGVEGVSSEPLPALDPPSTLDILCEAYGLSSFERDTLVLCAGVELDAEFHSLCGAAQGLAGRAAPTFSLALAALSEAHWSAVDSQAALRQGCLIRVLPGETLTGSPLRIEERVLHFLTGLSSFDERLSELLTCVSFQTLFPASQDHLARHIVELLGQTDQLRPLLLCGPDSAARQSVAAHVCEQLELTLYALSAADVPHVAADRHLLCRQWQRELQLGNRALLLHFDEKLSLESESVRSALALLERLPGVVFVSSRDPLPAIARRPLRFDVPRPTTAEQQALWQHTLGPLSEQLNGQLDSVISHFSMGQHGIELASSQALARAAAQEAAVDAANLGEHLWQACREQARPRLDDLAQRIDTHAGWNDLVLPETPLAALRAIVAHKRHQATVYHDWGFAKKGGRGLGISALFVGGSGTGKTLAAEVLANDLRLDLYRIDLSQVVSKYIGETEKNLRRVFDAAEEGGALLLFDEADALFGKRSEVRDSHDRYANIEVSYLLQRMEAYQGISILTTNMKSSLDGAFMRRIRFVVHFPFPDVAQRAELWRRVLPASLPTVGVDDAKLARLNLAGGHIRNIALNAAFLAAAAGEPLNMHHLLQSARLEYAKLEKPLTEAEIGGWI